MIALRCLLWATGALSLAGCTGDRVAWSSTAVCLEYAGNAPPPGWRLAAFWTVAPRQDPNDQLVPPVLAADVEGIGRSACVTLAAPPAELQQVALREPDLIDFVWRIPQGPRSVREHSVAKAAIVSVRLVPYHDADGDESLGGDDSVAALSGFGDRYGPRIGYVVAFDHVLGSIPPDQWRHVWSKVADPRSPFALVEGTRASAWNPVMMRDSWFVHGCPSADQARECDGVFLGPRHGLEGRWVDPRVDPARVGATTQYADLAADLPLPEHPESPGPITPAGADILGTSRACTVVGDLLVVQHVQAFRHVVPDSCICEHGRAMVLAVTPASDPPPGFACEATDLVEGEAAEWLRTAAGLAMPDEEPMPEE